ncbi:S-layer homology domain-containing protein [Bacillus sp. AK128]
MRKLKAFRLIIFFLSLTLLLPGLESTKIVSASMQQNKSAFTDVSSYKSEIEYLASLSIIKGYQDGTFKPYSTVNRLQAVQMILRELGITIESEEDVPYIPFTDLKPGEYGYDEVAIATVLGIVQGKDDGKFDPFGKLTRGQMAKIFYNAYNLTGKASKDFTDVKSGHWTYEYVHALAANEITTGYNDGSFKPNAPIHRMHFAAFLARYMNDSFKPEVTSPLTRKEIIAKQESVVMVDVYDEYGELFSQGSGFVTTNGLIITNFHVIHGGAYYEVTTHSGDIYEIEGVVDYEVDQDIAILKPFDRLPLKQLKLGTVGKVDKGDDVIAIGNPLGYQNSISTGIVSGIRNLAEEGLDVDMVQFTAPVTYGSSGGPLFNMEGYVIGLVSFGYEMGGLNFALVSDHVKELLSPYIGVPFYQMPIIPTDHLPVYEYVEEEIIEEPTPSEPTGPTVPEEEMAPIETVTTEKFYLSERLTETVFHPELPIMYGIDLYGDVVEVNYETQEINTLSLSLPTERIFYANNELYVTLLKGQHSPYWWDEEQEGGIAIIDTTDFTLRSEYDILIDPYDIVADENYLYVSSGSGQWTNLKSYNRTTMEEVDSISIYDSSFLEMKPGQKMMYSITTSISPRDVQAYHISNGRFESTYDSPYHGEHNLAIGMTVSKDGKYIFNHSGIVFNSTLLKSTNMTYLTKIDSFSTIGFDVLNNRFYTGLDNKIKAYDNQTFTTTDEWYVDATINGMTTWDGKVILLTTEMPNNVPVQSVQIFTP